MQCKKRAFIFGTISGLFWGLDYTLAGEIHTLVSMTFLVSMWLTSAHDLGVAATVGVVSKSSVKKVKDLSAWQIICICCIPLLGGLAMTMYMLSTKDIATGTAIVISSCYPAVGMIGARIVLKEALTPLKIVGFIIIVFGITLTAYGELFDKSNGLIGLIFAISAAIFWGLEGVLYKMVLNANVSPNTLLFLRKLSTVFIFLPFTFIIIPTVGVNILLLMAIVGIVGYIADLAYMQAFKYSDVALAMSLNITYIIWGPLFAFVLFNQSISIILLLVCAIFIFSGNLLIFKSKSVY